MIIQKVRYKNYFQRTVLFVKRPSVVFLVGMLILTAIFAFVGFMRTVVVLEPNQHFFTEPTQVQLKSSGLLPIELRYTTDGLVPTAQSMLYEQPLDIAENTVIQVAVFRDDLLVSDIYTFPIFIGADHELPVVSIVTDPDHLFDEHAGIYTNYSNTGADWERPAQLSFFEPGGELGFQKDVGIRMHGGGSRSYPQKTFRIYAGYLDHVDHIKYPLFPDLPYDTFNTFLLRAAGGDWERAYMRDALMHELAARVSDLDTQAVRPAVLYLNDQYWGIYYLRERIDQHYLANKYGLSRDNISILEIPHEVGENRGQVILDYGHQKAAEDYNQYFTAAQSCKDCAHYQQFSPILEMANFRDYMLLQIYSGNFDWPFGNVKLWRYEQPVRATDDEQTIIDGRFRWIFYDVDVGMGFKKMNQEDMAVSAHLDIYWRLIDDLFPFRNVFFDEKFKQEYLTRAAELLNTDLNAESVQHMIDQRAASIRSEMPRQIDRWAGLHSPQGVHFFTSMAEWEQNIDLLKTFAEHRPAGLLAASAEFFELSGLQHITLVSTPNEGGGVSIGAIRKSSDELPWQGTFFQETYMAVEAKPSPGYVFDHWRGDISENERYNQRVVILIADQEHIEAVFKKKTWYQQIIPFWK